MIKYLFITLISLYPFLIFTQNELCYVFYEDGQTDSTLFSYEWDLGDGTILKGSKVKHCFSNPGSYNIILNVIDEVTGQVLKQQANYKLNVKGKSAVEYNNDGVQKDNSEDYEGAIRDYTKAIELKPDYAKAYFNRGLTKGKMKDYESAITDHTKAIELKPDFPDPYHYRGIMEFYTGKRQEACKDIQKAADLGFEKSIQSLSQFCE